MGGHKTRNNERIVSYLPIEKTYKRHGTGYIRCPLFLNLLERVPGTTGNAWLGTRWLEQ